MKIRDAKQGVRVETKFGAATVTGVTEGKYVDLMLDSPMPGRKDQSDKSWQVSPRAATIVTESENNGGGELAQIAPDASAGHAF